jgi:predicted DNA-binding antitoxin AbrB/MazE fold protein
MSLTFEAIYENGVLKPAQPLPLREHEKVQVTVQPFGDWVARTYGILGWKGDAESAERFASDPELDFPPPAEET